MKIVHIPFPHPHNPRYRGWTMATKIAETPLSVAAGTLMFQKTLHNFSVGQKLTYMML